MPQYFEIHGYRSPLDATSGPFQYAFDTKLKFWDYIAQRPEDSQTFNTFMEVSRTGRSSWVDWFPIEERIITGFKDNDKDVAIVSEEHGCNVLLVDVGGGHGQDLREFKQTFPDSGGRLILQDLPLVIAEADKEGINDGIQMMEHDFFTPQPVKGKPSTPGSSNFLPSLFRCTSLLFPLCLPRLGRQRCPTHSRERCHRYGTRILQADPQRIHFA